MMRKLARKLPILLLIGSFLYVPVAFATGTSRIVDILLVDFVHLGDSQPVWEKSFHLHKWKLRRADYAAIEFVAVGVWEGTSSHITINGRKYVLPVSEPLGLSDIADRGKSVIPIPIGLLRPGRNHVQIDAGVIINTANPYDDFDMKDVTLVLSW